MNAVQRELMEGELLDMIYLNCARIIVHASRLNEVVPGSDLLDHLNRVACRLSEIEANLKGTLKEEGK